MGSVRQEKATRVNLIDNILLPPNNFKVVVEVGIVFFFFSRHFSWTSSSLGNRYDQSWLGGQVNRFGYMVNHGEMCE